MTIEERTALAVGGICIDKILYGHYGKISFSEKFKKIFDGKSFPILPKNENDYCHKHGIGSNTCILSFLGYDSGLSVDANGEKLSYSLSHPLALYYDEILQPIWNEQNVGKCKTCLGTGWDGCGYILTCVDCGGTGKEKL